VAKEVKDKIKEKLRKEIKDIVNKRLKHVRI
jgi:flagellar basal body-associated protein FliL